MKINLKLLQAFLLVAEHMSFARAAEQSHRSAQAVSMQIKQLEDQLGLTLFRRTTRYVELTREGSQLLSSVRRALTEIDDGLQKLQAATNFRNTRLAVACVPTVAGSLLPEVLALFSEEHPGARVTVHELGVDELLQSVRRGHVDFGIGSRNKRMESLEFRSVLDDGYYALIDPHFRASRARGITLRELAALPILITGPSSAFRDDIDAAARTMGIPLNMRFEVMQINTMIAMAEHGLGVAVVPHVAVPKVTRLKALRIIEPALHREIGIISLAGKPLSPVAQRFAQLIEVNWSAKLKAA